MSHRFLVGILALLLIATVIAASQYYIRQNYEQQLEAHYRRGFRELAFHLDSLEKELGKIMVVSSPEQRYQTLADIWRLIYAAQANLGQIPVSNVSLSRMENLLGEVQGKTVALAQLPTDQSDSLPLEDIEQLHAQVRYVNGELQRALADYELHSRWVSWRNVLRTATPRPSNITLMHRNPIMHSMVMIEDGMRRFPDSDFPSEMARLRYPTLEGPLIKPDQAVQAARQFLGELGRGYDYEIINEGEGRLPTYTVAAHTEGNSRITLEVSQRKGLVLWLMNPRLIGSAQLDQAQILSAAEDFLRERGFPSTELVGWDQFLNKATLVFAPVRGDGVLVYPEKLTVQVAADNGEVVGFQGVAYHTMRKERDYQPKLSEEEAVSRVTAVGEIVDTRLAVILNPAYQEVLTYQIRLDNGNEQYLIYINAANGREEKVDRVQPGEVIGAG